MQFFVKNRIGYTQIIVVSLLFLLLFSSHSWQEYSFLDMIIQWVGFVLIVITTLGRIWCFVYISGYKDDRLIQYGPYSLVRNPLYLFSFMGTIGLGLATENLVALALMVILFCVFYPSVVEEEESNLKSWYGETFEAYAQKTPRWIPDFKHYKEIEEYPVKPRIFIKAMLESMWFLLFFMILQVIENLHHMGILPVFLTIP
jgi:protein-S-isoprenylcysteine O-methyltransferase Ste14